jgi:aminoglycoside 6-adenylyltransferase
MGGSATTYDQLIERFVQWAETCSDIRAVVIVGSRARSERPADEWSDLDLLVLTTDAQRYLTQTDWLENIGSPWLTFLERTAAGQERERRVLFEGGLDVDFIPLSVGSIRQKAHDSIVAAVIHRGTRVLLDKDGVAPHLAPTVAEIPAHRPPTAEEFLGTTNDFWYHAVWTAKKLRRGELWTAKACSDVYMKRLLLEMVEWYAQMTEDWEYDTWFNGRFLERWAPPSVLDALRGAFGHYDEADVWRSLLTTMDVFRWLATEVAESLGHPYPRAADGHVTQWVVAHLPEESTLSLHHDG